MGRLRGTRGFYGNGLSVARDNVVIGIHRRRGTRGGEGGGGGREEESRIRGMVDGGKGCEINVRRLVYRQQSHAKSRGAHPRRAPLIHEPPGCPSKGEESSEPLTLLGYRVSPYRFYLFKSFPLSLHFFPKHHPLLADTDPTSCHFVSPELSSSSSSFFPQTRRSCLSKVFFSFLLSNARSLLPQLFAYRCCHAMISKSVERRFSRTEEEDDSRIGGELITGLITSTLSTALAEESEKVDEGGKG